MTDSLVEWLEYEGQCDAVTYSAEMDRLYFMSADAWDGLSVIQGSTHRLCWTIFEYFDGPRDICADTERGKLYCGSWPMGISIVDLSKRIVTTNLSLGSVDGEPVSGCANMLLGKNYILMGDGEVFVFDAVADTVITSLSLDSTMKWSLAACAANAGRVLCTAKDSEFGLLIDCAADSVVGRVRWQNPACVVRASPDGAAFAVATRGYLYVIDAASGTIIRRFDTGSEPMAVCYAVNLEKLYCADWSGRVYSVSMSSDSLIRFINLEYFLSGLCYVPEDSRMYVTTTDGDAVWVVDCRSDTVAARIDLADSGGQSPPAYSAFGNRVYFTAGDGMGVIECGRDTVVERIPHAWHKPCAPNVFPSMRLVSVTDESRFISILSDPPARAAVVSAAQGREPTVARGLLHITGGRTGRLFDLSGRNVLDLLPGWNDVNGLPPGVYFVREQRADDSGPVKTRKVIILR